MYLHVYGNPHDPKTASVVQVDVCEECKALMVATDYDRHAESHAPKKETRTIRKPE